MSATSALWSATSEPAAPIATPTRAAASAGASLTPSPTIATAPASRSSSCTCVELVGRAAGPARTSSMPARAGDGAGDGLGVAGEHHDALDAGGAQPLREAVGLRRAAGRRGRTARAARSPSPRAIAVCAGVVQRGERGGQRAEPLLHQPRPAGPQLAAVDGAPGRRGPGARGSARPPAPASPRSRAARRSAAASGCSEPRLDRRDERERRGPRPSATHPLQLREAEGERAGLVERDRATRAEVLERLAALDQDAAPRGAADGGDDGDRHGDHQRARAGDDQQRERAVEPRVRRRRRTASGTVASSSAAPNTIGV